MTGMEFLGVVITAMIIGPIVVKLVWYTSYDGRTPIVTTEKFKTKLTNKGT